jgi:hypothetical protein
VPQLNWRATLLAGEKLSCLIAGDRIKGTAITPHEEAFSVLS